MKRQGKLISILFAVCAFATAAALLGIYFFDWKLRWFAGWWTLFLMVPAVASMVNRGIRISNAALLGCGALLLAWEQEWIKSGRALWAAFLAYGLVLLGVSLLIHAIRPRKDLPDDLPPESGHQPTVEVFGDSQAGQQAPPSAGSAGGDGSDYPSYVAVFSSSYFRNVCRSLRGGRTVAVFGSSTVDLTQADFSRPICFEAVAVFGGIDLYVPAGVRVECTGVPIFGGFSAPRRGPQETDPSRPTLTVKYASIFGGVVIK
ncbi:MAG: cell wall-active antibiotics response protein [Oscillospiraceae bacterium]|nr:cell wall-active antibiotics response protein [Oscillospiraceae bacterium]